MRRAAVRTKPVRSNPVGKNGPPDTRFGVATRSVRQRDHQPAVAMVPSGDNLDVGSPHPPGSQHWRRMHWPTRRAGGVPGGSVFLYFFMCMFIIRTYPSSSSSYPI